MTGAWCAALLLLAALASRADRACSVRRLSALRLGDTTTPRDLFRRRAGAGAGSRVLRAGALAVALGMRPRPPQVDPARLAGELAAVARAGVAPLRAWQLLGEREGAQAALCRDVAAALDEGREPAAALHRAALADARRRTTSGLGRARPDAALLWLAAALGVCDRTGAPFADVFDHLAGALRAEESAAAERRAALAGPRATAGVLALLPAGGAGLGSLIGAAPVSTLLLTPAGRVCLLTGATLWAAGLWWTRGLVRRAARAGSGR